MKALEKSISKSESNLETLRSHSSQIEADIKAIQQKILDVGGIKLRSQKSKVDGIREQMDTLNECITKAEHSSIKDTKEVAKLEKCILKSEKEIETMEAEYEELNDTIRKKTEAALELRQACDEAKEVIHYSKAVYFSTAKRRC
jgi:structural maintenance of chromosome 4